MTSLLDRYRAGDHDGVWFRLRQLGARVREPEYRDDAEAVAREAMLRARRNVEAIIERLHGQGYKFGDPFSDHGARLPHAPPDERTPGFVEWVETRFGPLPMTARLWIETVGDVSLLGRHPAWSDDAVVDPLVVEIESKSWPHVAEDRTAARANHESNHEAWTDQPAQGPGMTPFALEVAPDALHKANISGGEPYGFLVPDESADATFRFGDGMLIPFVEYLRLAFRWGGFPGLWQQDLGEATWAARRALAEGLLPL